MAERKEYGMATDMEKPARPQELTPEQQRRAEAVRQLLATWLADDSGYDEHAWPEVERGLDESRTSSRPLFGG